MATIQLRQQQRESVYGNHEVSNKRLTRPRCWKLLSLARRNIISKMLKRVGRRKMLAGRPGCCNRSPRFGHASLLEESAPRERSHSFMFQSAAFLHRYFLKAWIPYAKWIWESVLTKGALRLGKVFG
jgi:hypothetical protein